MMEAAPPEANLHAKVLLGPYQDLQLGSCGSSVRGGALRVGWARGWVGVQLTVRMGGDQSGLDCIQGHTALTDGPDGPLS